MRARRHFQPMIDSMPIRIAPSSLIGVPPVVVKALPTISPPPSQLMAQDTLMPEKGGSNPVILEPVSPPSTLPC